MHSRHPQLTLAAALSPPPAAFAPLVRRCAAAEPMAVRQLAARALPPLLGRQELPAALAELAGAVAGTLCPPAAGSEEGDGRGRHPPLNAAHGWLLQLRLLLEGASSGSAGVPAEELGPGLAEAATQLG